MGLLADHMAKVETRILADADVAGSAGHNVNKGTPREVFIRDFLREHLSEQLGIGSGEIIDHESQLGESRNQIDVVLFRKDFPRILLGGDIYAYLAESVVATIEVKSILDKKAIVQSVQSAARIKRLKREIVRPMSSGHVPPAILNFVVGYSGPATMSTVWEWLDRTFVDEGLQYPAWAQTITDRQRKASPAVDAVFLLGKGFVHFDNGPLTIISDETRAEYPDLKWIIADMPRGALLMLFLALTQATLGASASWLNPLPYLTSDAIPADAVSLGVFPSRPS